jgi:hypothetical protein
MAPSYSSAHRVALACLGLTFQGTAGARAMPGAAGVGRCTLRISSCTAKDIGAGPLEVPTTLLRLGVCRRAAPCRSASCWQATHDESLTDMLGFRVPTAGAG